VRQKVCCSVLQCAAVCCNVFYTRVVHEMRQKVCCGILQCVLMCCSVLQFIVVRCNIYNKYATINTRHASKCVLQCVAVCLDVLQRVAVYCSVLQCVVLQ